MPEFSNTTSAEGASIGAAVGLIIVWLLDAFVHVEVPIAVSGAIIVVVTYLIARFIPPRAS